MQPKTITRQLFERDGYVAPLSILSEDEVARYRNTYDQLEADRKAKGITARPTQQHFVYKPFWDLATLARAEIENYPDLYKKYYSLTEYTHGQTLGSGAAITQANRTPLLGRVAGADGLKTGHTEEAGYGFTGSAEQNGRRLIMVVAGLDSFNQRITESVRLMQWDFNAWQAKPLFKSGTNVGSAQVQMGSSSEVSLVAPRDLSITFPAMP